MTISATTQGLRPGVCTSTSRPSTPFTGQLIFETDTNRLAVWNGTSWVFLADADTPPGLQLVKTQTIGTAVSSVTVTDAFSADFDVYEIVISGGAGSTTLDLRMALGSASANYYQSRWYVDYATATYGDTSTSNGSYFTIGSASTLGIDTSIQIKEPFSSRRTVISFRYIGQGTGLEAQMGGGFLNDANSYTAFTITASSGTLTGGTIRVYGYRNS